MDIDFYFYKVIYSFQGCWYYLFMSRYQFYLFIILFGLNSRSSSVVVKLLARGAWGPDSNPGLAATISEIGY